VRKEIPVRKVHTVRKVTEYVFFNKIILYLNFSKKLYIIKGKNGYAWFSWYKRCAWSARIAGFSRLARS